MFQVSQLMMDDATDNNLLQDGLVGRSIQDQHPEDLRWETLFCDFIVFINYDFNKLNFNK